MRIDRHFYAATCVIVNRLANYTHQADPVLAAEKVLQSMGYAIDYRDIDGRRVTLKDRVFTVSTRQPASCQKETVVHILGHLALEHPLEVTMPKCLDGEGKSFSQGEYEYEAKVFSVLWMRHDNHYEELKHDDYLLSQAIPQIYGTPTVVIPCPSDCKLLGKWCPGSAWPDDPIA